MRSFYKKWQDYHNEKISVTLSNNTIPRVWHLLEQGTSMLPMIPALTPQPLANMVKPPVLPHDGPHHHSDQNRSNWQLELEKKVEPVSSSLSALTYHFNQSHPTQATAVTSPLQSTSNSSSNPSPPRAPGQGQKRGAEDELDHGQVKKGRKVWRCVRCESIECPGCWQEKKCTAVPKVSSSYLTAGLQLISYILMIAYSRRPSRRYNGVISVSTH